MKKIDDYMKETGYYCESSTIKKLRNSLFDNSSRINCYDECVKYDDLSESGKITLIFSCMSIVFEYENNKKEVVEMLNNIYDFDLIKEYNNLYDSLKG